MRTVKAGSTSVILDDLFIQDSSSTTGGGLTNVAFNTSGLTCYYHRNTGSASVAVTLATMTVGTFAAGGFKKIDDTNMPGIYTFCPPDAAIASGAQSVTFFFQGVTNMCQTPVTVELVAYDPQDAVRAGLTALPNATAGANTGLPVVGTQVPNATAGAAGGLFIAGSNAATTIAGLTTGALSCTTVTASGAVAFQSTFAVTTSTSLAALSCTTLTASGAVAFQSTFAVTTSTSLAALSATTITASGAVAFQSTFAVTTSTSLGAFSCTTLTASGAVALQSTLTVTGAVLFSSTFATTGTTTFNAFTVTNAMTVSGTTTHTGAVSFGSTFGVTGTTTLAAVNTGAIGTGNVTITGTLSTSGTTTLNALTVTNATTLSGAVSLGSTLGVTGTTTFAAINTGAIGTGNVTITGTLSTSGTTTLNALTVTNATTLSGAVSLGSTLGVSGTVTFNAFTVSNALLVSGTTTLTGAWTATNAGNNVTGISATVSDKTGFFLAVSQAFNNTGTWTGNIVGTVSTLTTYTGNTLQTGDSFARIGATGSGLTSLAPSSTAATIAAYGDIHWSTATGFATPTNITAGTITTVTNLTNAATAGDFTATMKTSLNSATPALSSTGVAAIVTAIFAHVIEGTRSFGGWIRLVASQAYCVTTRTGSGPYTRVYQDEANTKPRITATTNSSGERSGITLDDS